MTSDLTDDSAADQMEGPTGLHPTAVVDPRALIHFPLSSTPAPSSSQAVYSAVPLASPSALERVFESDPTQSSTPACTLERVRGSSRSHTSPGTYHRTQSSLAVRHE